MAIVIMPRHALAGRPARAPVISTVRGQWDGATFAVPSSCAAIQRSHLIVLLQLKQARTASSSTGDVEADSRSSRLNSNRDRTLVSLGASRIIERCEVVFMGPIFGQ